MDEKRVATAERVSATEYAGRIRALLRKGGITSGLPRRTVDRWILFHAIAQGFRAEERLTEIEATQRIGSFLATQAPHWGMDRVTLRRALVDEGFLDREPDGTQYRASRRHERRVTFEDPPRIEAAHSDA